MENWKIIPFEDNYEVSDKGNVRNRDSGHVKSLRYDRYGYLRVTLYPSGKTYTVHKLVAKVWLKDTYEEGLQVDHLNAIRDDNRVLNLEWVTLDENQRRIKNRYKPTGEKNPCSVITDKIAYEIKYTFSENISDISKRLLVDRNIVEAVRRREAWTHVIDPVLEDKYLNGEITYLKGKTANLSKQDAYALDLDLINKSYESIKDLTEKYSVSRSTVFRRRRNLKIVE